MTLLDKVRNRAARVRQHRWRSRAFQSTERHIVIGGSPRSGTTLVRRTLDRHPRLCCGPESGILLPARIAVEPLATSFGMDEDEVRSMLAASASQGAFVEAFAVRYRELRDRPRWAEKTPLNVRHVGWILERFPNARFVHVIRDGRDVVCSMRLHPDRRWVDGRYLKVHRPLSLDAYARRWVADTDAGMAHRGDPRYLEVRYEDLVLRPEEVLARLLGDLGERFDPDLLLAAEPSVPTGPTDDVGSDEEALVPASHRHHAGTAISTGSMGRWRTDLTGAEQAMIQRIAGPALTRLGYTDT